MRPATIFAVLLTVTTQALPQRAQEPGKSIGSVTTRGDLVLVNLDENALGRAN